ncbi:MAG: hypothetical protein JJ934_05600, partial [Pseudomonadales bacterium]|nr:hypothetical protein [Pseudomonadales bacterium]
TLNAGSTAVNFGGAVAGTGTNTINVDITGDVDFGGAVGSTAAGALGDISVSGDLGVLVAGSIVNANAITASTSSIAGDIGTGTVASVDISGASTISANVDATTQTYGGAVSFTGTNTLTGAVTLQAGLTGTMTNTLNVSGTLNVENTAITLLDALTVSGAATLGANVSTVNNQTYNGLVTLAAGDRTLTSTSGTATFNAGIAGGGNGLIIAGDFALGATAASGLTFLTVNDTSDLGGNVTTSGAQTYTGNATISGGTVTLDSTGGALIQFGGTVNADGTAGDNLNIDGNAVFGGDVGVSSNLGNLSINGDVDLGGSVSTTGTQIYGDGVNTDTTTLNADLTLTAGGAGVTFNSTLVSDGVGTGTSTESLDIIGDVDFNNAVGGAASTNLQYIDVVGNANVDGLITTSERFEVTGTATVNQLITAQNLIVGGDTILNAGVTTTGTQVYGDNAAVDQLTLGAGVTLNAGTSTVTFNSLVDGANSLSVTGGAVFNGRVGGSTDVASITVSGDTTLNNDIDTTGDQTYGDDETTDVAILDTDVTLNSGGTVTFDSIVQGDTGGQTLTIATGDLEFQGSVGMGVGNNLGTIDVTAGELSITASGSVHTSGAITADSATILGAIGAGSVDSVVISTDTTLGADVQTTGVQTYGTTPSTHRTDLTGGSAITLSGTTITFNSLLDGSESLAVNATSVTLQEVGGGIANPDQLTITATTLNLNDDVTVDGAVSLASAGTVNLNNSISVDTTGGATMTSTISVGAVNTTTNDLELMAPFASDITLGSADVGTLTVSGDQLFLGGGIEVDTSLDLDSGISSITLTNDSLINVSNGTDLAITLADVDGDHNLDVQGDAASAITLNAVNTNSLDVWGTLTLLGNITVDENLDLSSNVTSITLGSDVIIDVASGGTDQSISLADVTGDQLLDLDGTTGTLTGSTIVLGSLDVNELLIQGGDVTLHGDIETDTAQDYTNVDDIQLAADVELLAIDGTMSQNITFDATNTITGTQQLTLDGDVVTTYKIGNPNDPTQLDITAATSIFIEGTVDVSGAVNLTSPDTNINATINSASLNLFGQTTLSADIITTDDLVFADVIVDGANIRIDTSGGDGDITFGNIDSAAATNNSLTLDAGNGNITVNGAVGSTDQLLNLTIEDATSATFASTIQALGLVSLTADLVDIDGNITAGGSISLIGTNVEIAGGTTIDAQGGALDIDTGVTLVTLDGTGTVTLQTSIADGNAVALAAVTATGTNNDLTISSTEGVNIDGTINIGTGDLDIDFDTLGGGTDSVTFAADQTITAGVLSVTGAGGNDVIDVTTAINATGDVTLETASTIDLDVSVTSGGAVTISGTTVEIAGGTTIDAQGGNLDIDTGVTTINLDGTGLVTLQTTSVDGSSIVLSAINGTGTNNDLTISSTEGLDIDGTINLGAEDLDITFDTLGGGTDTLTLDMDQSITAGDLEVSGTGNNDTINVTTAINASGLVSLDTASMLDIDANIDAGASATLSATNVEITAGTTIHAQNGNLDVDSGVTGITLDGTGTVTIDQDGEGATASLAAISDDGAGDGASLTISAEDGVSAGTIDLGGTLDGSLSITADEGTSGDAASLTVGTVTNATNVAITNNTGSVALPSITAGGTLDVVSTSTLSQGGGTSLTVTGVSTFDAGASNLVLTNTGNNFQDTVNVTAANNATIVDVDAIEIGTANIGSTLNVTSGAGITVSGSIVADDLVFDASAGAGDITDTTGDITVTGSSTFTVQATDSVLLDSATNDFGSVSIPDAQNVSLRDEDSIVLNASDIGGTLDVVAAGTITGSQIIEVAGLTTLDAGGTAVGTNNISLTNTSNDFAQVDITNAGDVTLADTNAITLGGSNLPNGTIDVDAAAIDVAGTVTAANLDFNATAGAGNISDSTGNLVVTGTSVFTVTGTDQINLDAATNDLNTVRLSAGTGTVLINDDDDITLDTSTVGGLLDVDADSISIIGAVSAGSATLDVSQAAGGITDTMAGTLSVTGATTITAQAGDNVALDAATNNFGSIGVTQANDVSIVDTDGVTLNASTIGGTLNVTADGNITGTQTLSVTGITTLDAGDTATGTNDISLTNASNDFSTLVITQAGDATVVDTNALTLNGSTVGGLLDVTADDITINAGQSVTAGSLNFTAGGTTTGTITIDETLTTTAGDMNFDSLAVLDVNATLVSGGAINVTNAAQIQLTTVDVTAAGDIDFDGAGSVTGVTIEGTGVVDLITTGDGNISLAALTDGDTMTNTTSLNLSAQGAVTVDSIDMADPGAVGDITIAFDTNNNGDLTFAANGNLTNFRDLSISGSGTADDTIQVNAALTTTSGNITLSDAQLIQLDADLTASGAILVSDAATVELHVGHTYSAQGGDLSMVTNVTEVEINGTATGTVTLNTDAGFDINLAAVVDAVDSVDVDLDINASGDVSIVSVDLDDGVSNDGSLSIGIDEDGTGAATRTLTVGSINNVDALDLSGTGANDDVALNGDVTLGSNLTTSGLDRIDLASGVDISGQTLNLSGADSIGVSGAGSILTSSVGAVTINDVASTADLTINAEDTITLGDVTLSGGTLDLDSSQPSTVTVNSFVGGGNITLANDGTTNFIGSVTATTLAIASSAGAVNFQDNATIAVLSTNPGTYSLSFLGDTTTVTNNVSFSNSGGLFFGDGGDTINLFGGATVNTSLVTLNGTLATSNSILTVQNLTLSGAGIIDSDGAAINISGNVDSTASHALTLDGGDTGVITVSGTVNNLSSLTITDAGGVSLNQNVIVGDLTTGAGNYSVSLLGSANQLGTNSLLHTGGLRLGNDATDQTTFNANFVYTAGDTNIAGDLDSAGFSVEFADVTLDESVDIDTTNADITFGSIDGGGNNLSLDAGAAGDIAVNDSMDDVLLLTLNGSADVTFNGTVGASDPGTIDIVTITGGSTVAFNGNTSLTDLVTTSASNYNIHFFGTTNQIASQVQFDNSGELRFGDGALDAILFSSGLTNPGGASTIIAGTLSSGGTDLSFATLTVDEASTATLDTSGGDLTITNLVGTDAASGIGESLIIDAGVVGLNGDVTINNVTGDAETLQNLTISDANLVDLGPVDILGDLTISGTLTSTSFNNTVNVDDATIASGSILLSNNFTATGIADFTGPTTFTAGLNLSAAGLDFTGDVTLAEGITVNLTAGNNGLSVNGILQGTAAGIAETLNIDAGATGAVVLSDVAGDASSLANVNILDSFSVDIDEISLDGVFNVNSDGDVEINSTDLFTSLQMQGVIDGSLTVNTANRVISSGLVQVGGSSDFTTSFSAPVGTPAVDLSNLDATGAVSITADSANVVNANTLTLGNITIGDPLDVGLPAADAYDASFTSTNGVIIGAGVVVVVDEFTLDASSGTGGVQLTNANNAFGSLDINSPTGTVNIRESDQTDIASIVVDELILRSDGDINATNAANVIGSLTITEGDAVTLSNTGALELRELNVTDLDLTTTGAISDTSTNTVTVSGITTIDPGGNTITFDRVNLGTISIANASDVVINEINDIFIDSIVANSQSITAAGNISQTAGSIVNVTNLFDLDGGGDVVLDGNNTFGSIQIQGVDVTIDGSGDITLETIDATTLTVTTSGGNITQAASTVTTVAGLATFETVGGNISLTDTASSFGSISLTGNDVEFTAAGAIEVEGIDASTLTFTAGGDITGAGEVVVTGAATFDAGSNDLNLTNVNNSIGTLSVTAGTVSLGLAQAIELDQLDVSGVFDITSTGDITDAASANINVGQAILETTGDIILGDSGSVDLAVLNISGANIDLTVSGSAEIESISGDALSLAAAGDITQSENSEINVGSASLSNGGNDIILTGNDNVLGSIAISSAGTVEITNNGAITLNNINADSMTLITSGAVSDGGRVNIAGTLSIDAGTGDILLDQNDHRFASLRIEGGDVNILDSSGDTTLLEVDVESLELVSAGNVVGDEIIRVDEDLEISADDGLGQILLNNESNRLNRLQLTGSTVNVINTLETELVDIDVNSLTLVSGGDVTDSPDDEIEVRGLATITAAEGFDILIGNNANDLVNIESVALSGDRIILNQNNDVLIESIKATGNLTVGSVDGGITAADGAVITAAGDANFGVNPASADIVLNNSTNSFGSLSVVGRDVSVAETDSTVVETVIADNFSLNSGGDIMNSNRATISVTLLGDITSAGDIVLGDPNNDAVSVDFGQLSLTAANADVSENSETRLAGLNIQNNLNLLSENSMTDEDGATLSVGGLATLAVTGQPQQILFDGQGNSFAALSLDSDNIIMNLADSTNLTFVRSDALTLNAPVGIISIANGSDFSVDQNADLRARRIVFNEDANVEVGSLSLTTRTGGAVEIRTNINPSLVGGNPTNSSGSIEITAPEVFLGVDGGEISLTTVGSADGGSVSINGVDASGLPDPSFGTVNIAGSVNIDTTNEGSSIGADINIVSDSTGAGTIRLQDTIAAGSLNMTAGTGSIDIGSIIDEARISALLIASAQDVQLDDVYTSGNTVDVTAAGDVTVSGIIDDAAGDVLIQAGGALNLLGAASAAGDIELRSTNSTVSTQSLDAGSDVRAVSEGTLLLGSNISAGAGTVTLLSADNIESLGTISSGNDAVIIAANNVTLGGEEAASVSSGGDVTITADAGDVSITDVSAGGDAVVFSLQGMVAQTKDSVLEAGDKATVSAETGMEIASIQASGDITLLVNQETVVPGEEPPNFTRVNDPIPLGQGEENQDVRSTNGSIVFLAPVANVGSTDADQNFVLRAGSGIFFGLDQGSFFSDDLGATAILNSLPTGSETNVSEALTAATAFDVSGGLIEGVSSPVQIDNLFFTQNLQTSFNASASAGQTNAASSSRSTAASQGDDEEEVAEVDEVAFQNLKNYDENPQGILLPEDQNFAYDDEGNIYLVVTLQGQINSAPPQAFTVFKVEMDLESAFDKTEDSEEELAYGYRMEFLALGSGSGED